MPNFDDSECLTEADIRAAFTKTCGEDKEQIFAPWIHTITNIVNLAYRTGLETGYEIAEAEYNALSYDTNS